MHRDVDVSVDVVVDVVCPQNGQDYMYWGREAGRSLGT